MESNNGALARRLFAVALRAVSWDTDSSLDNPVPTTAVHRVTIRTRVGDTSPPSAGDVAEAMARAVLDGDMVAACALGDWLTELVGAAGGTLPLDRHGTPAYRADPGPHEKSPCGTRPGADRDPRADYDFDPTSSGISGKISPVV